MDDFGIWVAIALLVEALAQSGSLNRKKYLDLLSAAETAAVDVDQEDTYRNIAGLIVDVSNNPQNYLADSEHVN